MGQIETKTVSLPLSGITPHQEAVSPLPKNPQIQTNLSLVDELRSAVQKLQKPTKPPTKTGEPECETAVDVAIRRIITSQKTENRYPPSFEDIFIDMNPKDLDVIEKLKEEVEKRG